MTDREIIDTIKRDIIFGATADFLTLKTVDLSEDKMMYFSEEEDRDNMFKTLFDYSLTKTIVFVNYRRFETNDRDLPFDIRSYNGGRFPIIGYTFGIRDSEDHDTNITPRLMKFLEVIMIRVGLDNFASPMGRNRIEYEFRGYSDGVPICCIPPEDPWEMLESYMEGTNSD